MVNPGNAGGGNKPATSRLLSPNMDISSSDGINRFWPSPAPAPPAGSRSGPEEELESTKYSRPERVGMTGERLVMRLNDVLGCAKEIGSLANSDVSCGGDSMHGVERETGGCFLRTGRIHGGRTGFGMNSSDEVGLSSGICVTRDTIRCEVISTGEHTPAKLFHHIA